MPTVGCLLIPRFSLIAALGDRREMLGSPVALAPEPGSEQVVGEVSGAAEAFGIRPGTGVSEAFGRCPALALVPPDPGRAEAGWEGVLRSLEGIGAAVESARPGEAFFALDGLRGLWGPRPEDVLARAGAAVRKAKGLSPRPGGGPTRFCAFAVAGVSRPRRAAKGAEAASRSSQRTRHTSGAPTRVRIVRADRAGRFLAPLPVDLLRERLPRPDGARAGATRRDEEERRALRLVGTLERLGVETLGALAALPRVAVADRFGRLGLRAHELASGVDAPLRPRPPAVELVQAIGLPEAIHGAQLHRALELLVERLLADPDRRGRRFRSLRLEAALAGGGSWRATAAQRSATASAERLRLALEPKLATLPGAVSSLALRALELGPPGAEPEALVPDPAERRRERIGEAVRQARAVAGRDAVLRVLDVEPGSRVPERWATLVPRTGGER